MKKSSSFLVVSLVRN